VIDKDGYRANVGIIICNKQDKLFWARRTNSKGWQFPQGGMDEGETPEQTMYRELYEEVGLKEDHIEVLGKTGDWGYYDLPEQFLRRNSIPFCRGQKQIWFLLRLVGEESEIHFDSTNQPEFDRWRWVDYWEPAFDVVYFKRNVYLSALTEMWALLFPGVTPKLPRN
jgi:putative (di)nucleoside polyphosphate hydrolase